MPYTASEHQESKIIELSSFVGGINSGIPSTQIADNECVDICNMFMDRRSGRLRTRYPILAYSNTATSAALYGIYYWKENWILASTDGRVYYLDGSKDPQPLGVLNGTGRPCFCPFNDKLIIASGGALQSISISGSTPQEIADVAGASTAAYVMEKYSRLVTSGDPSYPDRIIESNYATDTTWTATDYADVGYMDDTSVIGITEAFEGMYLVFKRGSSGLRTYYLTSLSATNPVSVLATDGHSPRAHAGIVRVMDRVYLMEEHYVSSLVGTDAQGKIIYDQNPGLKLGNILNASASCCAITYPRDAQIWFIPDPSTNEAYIYHYHLNAWTRFTFGSRKIWSAFYNPVEDYLYLGCDDGYMYLYDYGSMAYADTDGAYTSRVISKMFAQGNREMVLKSPRLIWVSLASGSGTMKVVTDYGQTSTSWGTVSVSAPQEYVYDTADRVMADLTTHTEVDVGGDRLLIAARSITVTACTQQDEVYAYYDYTAAYFDDDFSFSFYYNQSSATTVGIVFVWGLSNYVDDLYASAFTNAYSTYFMTANKTATFALNLGYVAAGGAQVADTSIAMSEDTTYFIHISRDFSAETLTAKIYNEARTTLIDTLSVSCGTDAYRYLYSFSGYKNNGTTKSLTGTISDYSVPTGNASPLYVYDTRAGGTYETYVWPETTYEELKGDYNQPNESFQFDLALTSGGFMIERLVAEISPGRRA